MSIFPDLAKYMPPKLALTMLMSMIREHVKHDVHDYILYYDHLTGNIDFKVYYPKNMVPVPSNYTIDGDGRYTRMYHMDDPSLLISTVKGFLASHHKEDKAFNYFFIFYHDNGERLYYELYLKNEDGEQLKLTKQL